MYKIISIILPILYILVPTTPQLLAVEPTTEKTMFIDVHGEERFEGLLRTYLEDFFVLTDTSPRTEGGLNLQGSISLSRTSSKGFYGYTVDLVLYRYEGKDDYGFTSWTRLEDIFLSYASNTRPKVESRLRVALDALSRDLKNKYGKRDSDEQ